MFFQSQNRSANIGICEKNKKNFPRMWKGDATRSMMESNASIPSFMQVQDGVRIFPGIAQPGNLVLAAEFISLLHPLIKSA
jgi:hypothetical protein